MLLPIPLQQYPQITQWKKQLLEGGTSLFGQQRVREQHEQSTREAELFEHIGRLKMELEWLKKKADRVS